MTLAKLQIPEERLPAPTEREAQHYWKRILATLHQRGQLRKRPRQGGYVAPQLAATLLLPERIIFILDMQQLGGIGREIWASDPDLRQQWGAALDGRVIFATDAAGLALTVGRDPALGARLRALSGKESVAKLPRKIPLTLEDIPPAPYTVRLGYAAGQKPVDLDLEGAQRAILTGGATGYGKTNFLLSALLQLASKNRPETLQLAVIDLKEVDFTGALARLPHYFRPVAYDLAAAEELIERVEAERIRRQTLLHQAEVPTWQAYNESNPAPFPLLLLIIDEVADLAATPTRETLIQLARKGRATRISLLAATQHPTGQVLDAQIKANLPTAIAFRTRSQSNSRVILDHGGAEQLRVPGRALTFLGGWQTVQTLCVDREIIESLVGSQIQAPRPTFSADERFLIELAQREFQGEFKIQALYQHPANAIATPGAGTQHRVSKRRITRLAHQWEQRGWLTVPLDVTSARRLTAAVRELL